MRLRGRDNRTEPTLSFSQSSVGLQKEISAVLPHRVQGSGLVRAGEPVSGGIDVDREISRIRAGAIKPIQKRSKVLGKCASSLPFPNDKRSLGAMKRNIAKM